MAAFDQQLFQLINQQWIHPLLDSFFVTITSKDFWTAPAVAAIIYLLFFNAKRGRIVFVLLLLTVSFTDSIAYKVIKPGIKRYRPCHALENTRVLEKCGGKWSMPSNHAANFFAAATILGLFYRRGRLTFFTVAVLSGAYSRIYVGKHYPGDVLAGALFGMAAAFLFYYFWVMIRVRLEKQNKYSLSLTVPKIID
ncbi:MAG: phosphatase PAP2 family protein [Candidatus Marinimicrobia bacterium]|nr:phosphatase PAP2 family protein [Candidatus Neomarinimicrobiota bacterium]